jgi:hypothetical protein
MTDSKNIVIKVKYTAPGTAAESPASATRMVTEWNIKRIAGAVGIVMLLLVSLTFLLISGKFDQTDTVQRETAPNKAPVSQPSALKAEPQTALAPVSGPASVASSDTVEEPVIPNHSSLPATSIKTSHAGRIRRAELAYRIIDKEPAELIGTNVRISNGKPVRVHYFTEVRGKAAQTLFHEWLKNGQTITRHPMAIGAERWRTSSERELKPDDQGNWSVRTVDDKGAVMNEIHFTVSVK